MEKPKGLTFGCLMLTGALMLLACWLVTLVLALPTIALLQGAM